MMAFTKKSIIYWLTLGLLFLSFWYATNEISCTQSTSPFSNCVSKYIYLSEDNNQNNLPDYSFLPKANYIYNEKPTKEYNLIQLMTGTHVKYYMTTGSMLYTKDTEGNIWVMDDMLFKLQSRAFEYQKPVRSIWISRYVNVEIPTLTGLKNPSIGFQYNHVLKKAIWYQWTTTSNYRRRLVPSLDYFSNEWVTTGLVDNLKRRARSDEFTYPLCVNYTLQRCGDGKIATHTGYWIGKNFTPIASWISTWFTTEFCDSTTTGGVACTNGTAGCCNATCTGYGSANERCGDEKLQPAGTYYNGDENNMSFEECDDGDQDGDTDGMINGDDPNFHFCSTICLPTFTEAFVEVFIN